MRRLRHRLRRLARVVIVVPCYNEASRLPVDAFVDHRLARDELTFLFVDDGSTDATHDVLAALAERRGWHRTGVLKLEKNGGKAEAVRRGVLEALDRAPDYVGYWDADLATPLEEIPRFLEVLDTHDEVDLVLGSRVKLLGRSIERHVHRHAFGRLFATAVATMLALPIYDSQCGAKLFRVTPDLRSLFDAPFVTRWIFDVELLARLISLWEPRGVDVAERLYELPLQSWHDVAGSKVSSADAVLAGRDLWRIAARYRESLTMRRRRFGLRPS